MRLLFFIRVADDDHLAIAGQSEEVTVELAEQPFGELSPCAMSAKKSSSSSEYEDISITGAILEAPPAQAPVGEGGRKRPMREILVVVETQTGSAVASWHR
jgi:hypothetical protein